MHSGPRATAQLLIVHAPVLVRVEISPKRYYAFSSWSHSYEGLAYSVNITNVNDPAVSPLIITPTWTRGMALHSLSRLF